MLLNVIKNVQNDFFPNDFKTNKKCTKRFFPVASKSNKKRTKRFFQMILKVLRNVRNLQKMFTIFKWF